MKKFLLSVLTLTVFASQANEQMQNPMAQAVRNADLIEVKTLLKGGQYSYSNRELSELMKLAKGEIAYCKSRITFWNRIMNLAKAGKPVATLLGMIGGGLSLGRAAIEYGTSGISKETLRSGGGLEGPVYGVPGFVAGAAIGGKGSAVTASSIINLAKRKKGYFEKRKKNLEIIVDLLYEQK